jgi:hypothetical protein
MEDRPIVKDKRKPIDSGKRKKKKGKEIDSLLRISRGS